MFYGLWIFAILLNAETWFFGVKFSGEWALLIHLPSGILGIILGILIIKKKRIAYYAALILFAFIILNIQVNQWTSPEVAFNTWSRTAEGMERQVDGPTFIFGQISWQTLETIWIVILTIPGLVIIYKFYKQIKLKYYSK